MTIKEEKTCLYVSFGSQDWTNTLAQKVVELIKRMMQGYYVYNSFNHKWKITVRNKEFEDALFLLDETYGKRNRVDPADGQEELELFMSQFKD